MYPQTKIRKQLLLLLTAIILVFVGYEVYFSTTFHLVSTNPSTHSVATASPFFKINFNRPLVNSGLRISASPNIISSYSLSGKTIDIVLKTPLNQDQAYTISLNNVSDTNGKTIASKVFSFKPKYIASQDLPADQRQALLKVQTQHTPSRNNIGFTGIDSLVNYGLTLAQVDAFKQAVFLYSKSAKLVGVDPSSVVRAPHNPESDYDTMSFNMTIDSSSYKATINYFSLTTIRLFLDSSGSQVYDSQNITTATNENP